MRLDNMDAKRSPAVRGPYTNHAEDGHGAIGGSNNSHDDDYEFTGRNSEAFEVPRNGFGAQPDARTMQSQGYAVPEAQFEYDTGYHGGHAERVFGA